LPLSLSVVVVAYDMRRELPRTLQSLAPDYQRGVDVADYEVVVVDNGSPEPLDAPMLAAFPGRIRTVRVDPAPPSPARAANLGVDMAEGAAVGLIVDGARIASPGLLAYAQLAMRVADRPVVTAPGYHLGAVRHMDAHTTGHDQRAEDRLLAAIDWPSDGYRLFEIAILAASSGRGWFGPMGESSALFLPRQLWTELGGLDEGFTLPGGGLVNHDLYRRACSLPGAQLIALLGEGTFHQFHGGAATSRRVTWDEMNEEYEALRHDRYRPPPAEPLYLGHVPPSALSHVEESARLARERISDSQRGSEVPSPTVYGAFLDR
jgi:Glycosyltransferase like family 2